MSGGLGRAALWGAGLALVAVTIVGLLFAFGVIESPKPDRPVTEVLVIGLAPDESGGEAAAIAVTLDLGARTARALDTEREAPLPGTSARNARDAYAFGGGDAVSRCLAVQTGGEPLPWVVLEPDVWGSLLDAGGGVRIRLERGISIYLDGTLTVIGRGKRTLTGAEAVAMSSASRYVGEAQRASILRSIGDTLGEALLSDADMLRELIDSGRAKSDIDPARLPAL